MLEGLAAVRDEGLRSFAEIVPPEILEPPGQRGSILRDEAAFELDGYLRRLARQDALCRRVLGRIAAAFLSVRGHHRLGFARIGDYTRERLGLSAREVQSLAAVTKRLDELPSLEGAFLGGDLSWSQLRILAGVASSDNEEAWLSLARGRTVRELEATVRSTKSEEERETFLSTGGDDDDTIDGEERLTFRMACPRHVTGAWRATVALARKVAGEELPVWKAAETIAAEALSGLEAPLSVSPTVTPPRIPGECPGDRIEPFSLYPHLGWTGVAEAIPEEVERLAASDDPADSFELDSRMRVVLRAMQKIDWQMGRLLRLLFEMRLHRRMGFRSTSHYVRERLGISAAKARALVALERKGWQVPGLAQAYREGDISWVKALVLLPVADPDHGGEWLERARSVTLRRLSDEVDWAIGAMTVRGTRAVPPPPPGAQLFTQESQEERQTCALPDAETVDSEIVFSGPASVVGLLRSVILALAGPSASPWRGLERLLEQVWKEWQSQPRHRDPIFAREGWRCAVPGCTSRRNLHDHHLRFRSRGGSNARENRVATCAWHHLHGIHDGRVRAAGRAPDRIVWELGVRRHGAPLLRLLGEQYL